MTATALSGTPESAAGQKLTPQELDQARLFLQQTENAVVGATKGLSDAQWTFKPAVDRWSIAEILDHVVMVQERVAGPLLGNLASAPPPPAGQDSKLVDAIVINQFTTRLSKFPAPEFVRPAADISPVEFLIRLRSNYALLAEHLESTPGLRRHAVDAPPLKAVSGGAFAVMDGYQWILAAAAHTERHAKQMLEVKADPNYPS